jgi:transposase
LVTTELKRQYDRAFKERAVKLSQGRDNIKELARELGVSPERIYKWRAEFAQHGEASFQGRGVERLSEEGKQVKELQKKLRNTELELEILKKAIAVLQNTGCASAILKQA